MTLNNLLLLLLIVFLILLSGFLSGSETAITAASKARIIARIKKGSDRANYVKKIIDKKEAVISSLLLSNNLVNILASSLATAFFYDLFGLTGIFYSTLLMTFLLVLFAEVLPKTYSINQPTRTAIIISPIIYYLNKLLFPFVFFINSIVNLMINKKPIPKNEEFLETMEWRNILLKYLNKKNYLITIPNDLSVFFNPITNLNEKLPINRVLYYFYLSIKDELKVCE